MAHETATGSSPIIKALMVDLQSAMPPDERQKLEQYWAQVDASKSQGDFHRARRCLHWAITVAEAPEHSHLAREAIRVKETYKAWQDLVLGAEFGTHVETRRGDEGHLITGESKVGPREDVEFLWVSEAVSVAKMAAEKSGWDQVPWEQLVQDVLQIN